MLDKSEIRFDPGRILSDGSWHRPANGELIALEDPSDGSVIAEVARGRAYEINRAVAGAVEASKAEWGRMPAFERGRILQKVGRAVTENADLLARFEAHDVGKPLKQAKADVAALARYFEFYGGAADKVHGQTIPYQHGYTVYTLREPHGVSGHIIPWNYPLQILGRSVGAALAMGNATVVKPAEEACLSVLAFAMIALHAGLPAGALNVVPGYGEEAGALLASHRDIDHLSFTGSVAVGRQVQAAAAENLVPVILELGGKSPQIVFDDADLDAALPFLVNAGIQNAGQTCSASSRILVQRGVYDRLLDMLSERYRALRAGPAIDDYDLGPLISAKQKDTVMGYIDGGEARIAAQGEIVAGAPSGGHYVRPTLFADVDPTSCLAQEEIFGPVQVVIPFSDEAEAVRIANGTKYGLVAGIWTRDGARQMRLAKAIRSGQVFINNYGAGGGIELPFGGTGHSGHGREKGFEALYGFSRVKTVAARHG